MPLVALLLAAAAVAALALKQKQQAPSTGVAASVGIPSYPIASAALTSAANQALAVPPVIGPPPAPAGAPAPAPAPAPPAFIAPPPPPPPLLAPPAPAPAPAPAVAPPRIIPWSPAMVFLAALPALSSAYTAHSAETVSIQQALNAWMDAVGYGGTRLATDGSYGPMTQRTVAQFQSWQNAANPSAALAIDGLAGPITQTFLLDFGPLTQGAY
jgi:hypothetical protein